MGRIFLVLAAPCFLIASALVVFGVGGEMRKQALKEAEEKARIVLSLGPAVHGHHGAAGKAEPMKLAGLGGAADGFDPARMSSIHAEQKTQSAFNSLAGGVYTYRECAINARSPENEADEWEKAFIEESNRDPLLQVRSAVREIDGKPYLMLLGRGGTMGEQCLRCHSSPEPASRSSVQRESGERSFGSEPGEVVSAFSVRVPISEAYEAANGVILKLSGALAAIFFVLVGLWLTLSRRFIFRPLSALCEKAIEISSAPGLLGEEIPLPPGKELAHLTAAFNGMSVALRREMDALEERARQAAVEISDVRALLRGIINTSQDFIFVKGMDFRYLVCNTALMKEIGRDEEEILGHEDSEWVPDGEAVEYFRRWDRKVLEEGKAFCVKEESTRPDGRVVHYETVKSPYVSEAGKLLGVIGVARDVTARTQAEEALRRSEEKFAKSFHSSPVAMSLSSMAEGRLIDVNRAFEMLLGRKREEIVGKTSVELGFIEPEERALLGRMLNTQGRIRDLETKMSRPSGETLRVKISVEPVDIASEQCVLFIGEDITEKKRMEEALRESEKLFSEIFHLSPEIAIITRKSDGMVIAMNDAFLNISGFSRNEVLGKSTIELGIWKSSAERQNLLDTFRREGIVKNAETVLHKKSGEPFPVMYSMVSVEYKGRPCLFAIGMDITEQKKAEEERKRLEGLLHHSQKMEAVGTLAGGIAHDFNNILAAIIGYTELARAETIDRTTRRGYLDQIHKASLRARDLVKQILIFSRMGSSDEPQPLKLSLVMRETLKFLRASIPATIDIRQNISLMSDTVLADPAQVNQVLVNLATNAAHAMEEKGGVLEVSLRDVALSPDLPVPHPDLVPGDYIMLSVNDTGHGIPPETIKRIFDPYFTTKESGKGTGLGLAIVHGIVKRHGGAVTAQSEAGAGTTFRVYLPKVQGLMTEEDVESEDLPGGTEGLLFIDDEEPLADIMHTMLSDLGYRVTCMTRPVEALALFRENPSQFDLVITDYTMPGLTGADLVTLMRDVRRDMPIIMATGFSERMSDEKAKDLRLDAFLLKPLQRSELAQAVREVLDASKGLGG
jgi:PAS domain S-box-containing protein